MGDAIAINMFLLGAAWQAGRVPIGLAAIERAIALNGVQVKFNRAAFEWGRRMIVDQAAVQQEVGIEQGNAAKGQVVEFLPRKLHRTEDILADRTRRLTDYQSKA